MSSRECALASFEDESTSSGQRSSSGWTSQRTDDSSSRPSFVARDVHEEYSFEGSRFLGKGSYGKVYAAVSKSTGEQVAVKRISLQGLSPAEVAFAKREPTLHLGLRHKNLVELIAVHETDAELSLVLELLSRDTASSVLSWEGVFSEERLVPLARQVLEALHYLHERNIMHLDVKPGNLVFAQADDDGQETIKLVDFGLARRCSEYRPAGCGTKGYMAPEVANGQNYDTKSDMWSLGATLYKLLLNDKPGASAMARLQRSRLSPAAKSFLRALLAEDPACRPDAAAALQHEWLAEVSDESVDEETLTADVIDADENENWLLWLGRKVQAMCDADELQVVVNKLGFSPAYVV